MEKKEIQEWRDRLIKMFGIYHSDGQEYITCPLCGINLDELAKHMIEELDKAREEGYGEGWGDCERFHLLLEQAEEDILSAEEITELDLLQEELSKLKDNK